MERTVIYLVRHGQTEWNAQKRMQGRLNSPLTEMGKFQAEKLSQHLQDIEFNMIFSSPSKRAYETAQIIKGKRNKSIIPVDELMEISLGDMEGMLYDDLLKNERYKKMAENFRKYPENYENPKGESFMDVRNRVMPFFNDTVNIFKGKKILIVSHTCTIKSILNTINETPIKDFWLPMIEPTSYSTVVCEDKKCKIVDYGSTAHLSK